MSTIYKVREVSSQLKNLVKNDTNPFIENDLILKDAGEKDERILQALKYLDKGAPKKALEELQSIHCEVRLEIGSQIENLKALLVDRSVLYSLTKLSKDEKNLIAYLRTGEKHRLDVISHLYPRRLRIEDGENRLKQLLFRLRKKMPDFIECSKGYIRITE